MAMAPGLYYFFLHFIDSVHVKSRNCGLFWKTTMIRRRIPIFISTFVFYQIVIFSGYEGKKRRREYEREKEEDEEDRLDELKEIEEKKKIAVEEMPALDEHMEKLLVDSLLGTPAEQVKVSKNAGGTFGTSTTSTTEQWVTHEQADPKRWLFRILT